MCSMSCLSVSPGALSHCSEITCLPSPTQTSHKYYDVTTSNIRDEFEESFFPGMEKKQQKSSFYLPGLSLRSPEKSALLLCVHSVA